jgi:proteasome assembly chaperone (PAC2) family protein
MMIAYSIEEPPLMKGGLWGIGRMGKMIADSMDFFQEKILAVFQNDDPEILGLAAWAMGEVGFKPSLSYLENLHERNEPVRIYINGDFSKKHLGQWAEEAMNKIAKPS